MYQNQSSMIDPAKRNIQAVFNTEVLPLKDFLAASSNMLDREETRACEIIVSELFTQINEKCKKYDAGKYYCIHISPVYDNFGAVAQVTVLAKVKTEEFLAEKEAGDINSFTEKGIKDILLRPAVKKGRIGGPPQQILINVFAGEDYISGLLTLFIGMRRSVK